MSAVTGLTLWGVLLLGVAATGTGALSRVPLAVLTLTALASFEAVTALPATAIQLGQARASTGGHYQRMREGRYEPSASR